MFVTDRVCGIDPVGVVVSVPPLRVMLRLSRSLKDTLVDTVCEKLATRDFEIALRVTVSSSEREVDFVRISLDLLKDQLSDCDLVATSTESVAVRERVGTLDFDFRIRVADAVASEVREIEF